MNKAYFFTAITLVLILVCTLGIAAEQSTPASDAKVAEKDKPAPRYTKKGADTCIKCHDEDSEFPVFSIFKTKHAQPVDQRTPFAGLQCESCHGPGANHAKRVRRGEQQAPIIGFGANSILSPEKQSKICLECHTGNSRIHWNASIHESGDIACVSCHKIHHAQDPVLAKLTQPEVCYQCHQQARDDFYKPSVHPVRFGVMSCSDCHNTHGSNTEAQLTKLTLNQTCYSCHAEKRGPFIWEHAPVTEDCSLCHSPHGSIHPTLLTKRPPLLCQQCHSQIGHPSSAQTGAGLPGGNPSAFLLSGACLNCHSQVHGSNHPSGVKQMR